MTVKTSCGARIKIDLVIKGTGTEIKNPVLKYLGEEIIRLFLLYIEVFLLQRPKL